VVTVVIENGLVMMFRHINDPQADLESIRRMLNDGWMLYLINDDKAYFQRWTNQLDPSDSTSSKS
jgi:hypothetical protein